MPVMIRKAVMGDMDELMRLGRAFHNASPLRDAVPFDEETAQACLNWLLGQQERGEALLLVSDHIPNELPSTKKHLGGILALNAFPGYFNKHIRLVQELFWWAEDGHGLDMLIEGRLWVQQTGGGPMMLTALGRDDTDFTAAYKRLGFVPIEQVFVAYVPKSKGE